MFRTEVVEKIKTHIHTPPRKYRAVIEVMWKNTAERGRLQMAIWRLRIACRIPASTNTLRLCSTLFGFPLQKCTLPTLLFIVYIVTGTAGNMGTVVNS